jgi:hypothetical protein
MFRRRQEQKALAELAELEARIEQCLLRLADVAASCSITMEIVARLEEEIDESQARRLAAAAEREKQARIAPPQAARKRWSWRGRRAAA